MNQWHRSHLPAEIPVYPPMADRLTGQQYLQQIRETLNKNPVTVTGLRQAKNLSSWHSTPEPFRKLVARAAGLPVDVSDKLDKDLSESEKTAIRDAARRLKERADTLFAL